MIKLVYLKSILKNILFMKSTKLIVFISEIWNNEQLQSCKICLLKGLEEISKKYSEDNLFKGIEHCNVKIKETIELENCKIDIIPNARKDDIVKSINDNMSHDNTLILYVGEVTVPFGQWIVSDGIFHSNNLISILTGDNQKKDGSFSLITPSPCEDWQIIDKKQLNYFSLVCYGLDNNEHNAEFNVFVDGVCAMLQITPVFHQDIPLLATIATRNPSLYFFLDRGSSASPALLTLDGFAMLLNCGFNRNSESLRYLKYFQQIDVGLLSHITYNNLLGWTSYAMGDSVVKINHLFVPGEVNFTDKVTHSGNPFHVDLKTTLTTMVNDMKNKGMQLSNLSVKAKTGASLTANNIKPIQLFHKIGYGSLEMIPLSPFEDDSDVKKFTDEWKKSKYSNDSLAKSLPSTASVLLIWKPFNNKVPIKRIIYIGSKCSVKKYFPTLIATLYSTYDFLKQTEYVPADGLIKKTATTRKATPPVAPATKPLSKPSDNNISNKKPGPTAEKPSRPVTVSAQVTHNSKEAPPKRPLTAGNKPKPEVTKPTETKKPIANKPTAPSSTTTVPVTGANKKTQNKKISDVKSQAKDTNHSKSLKLKDAKVVPNGTHQYDVTIDSDADLHRVTDMDAIENININGDVNDKIELDTSLAEIKDISDDKSNVPDASPVVAVGTVECAITEHGEADFCDDTPEELSADQMRQMGLIDDEEEDKGETILSSEDNNEPGIGNIAHLPMEGSFYGKETVDNNDKLEWNQPVGMPMPVKDSSGNQAKKSAKCPTPIHVDCLCVPSDLDKEDLRYLFECVKSTMVYLQLEKATDLVKFVEILLEEKEKDGGNGFDTTVIPSLADESYLLWSRENVNRIESCRIKIETDLSRRSITTFGGGDQPNDADSCHGMKWEF